MSWPWAFVVGLVIGLVGAAVASPTAGVVAGVVSVAAVGMVRGGWARTMLLGGAAVVLAVAAAGVVVGQIAHMVPEGSTWPATYNGEATLAWIAIVLLAADAIVESVRGRRGQAPRRRRSRREV